MRGVGVDCFRYACAIYDELLRIPDTITPRLPQDAATHDGELAESVVRLMLRHYAPVDRVLDSVVEPGDAVIVGPAGKQAHLYVVGARPSTMWHASPPSVQWTGIGTPLPVLAVYRFRERLVRWA